MKIKPSLKKITLLYLVAILLVGCLLFLGLLNNFLRWPWDFVPILTIVLYVLLAVSGYLFAVFKYYYVLEKDYLAVVKMGHEYRYNYSDIVYIDNSRQNLTLTFFTVKKGYIYLTCDKQMVLVDELLKRCKSATSDVKELKSKYPAAR